MELRMTSDDAGTGTSVPRGRLALGGSVLVFGFLCPLFVPLVTASDLPTGWKATLSGFLILGIPELFMVIAVAIMGKEGFAFLKARALGLFKKHVVPAEVGPVRYRIGLALFTFSLLLGWASPYVDLTGVAETRGLLLPLLGDGVLLVALFVLGGDFWDKIRALFVHGARAEFPEG
jgi:hypothetical protein